MTIKEGRERLHYFFDLYLVEPGIVLWLGGTCHSIYWHKMPQGWKIEYIKYVRTEPEKGIVI